MTREVWRFIALLGVVAVAVGLYLGFGHVSVPAINGTQDCGSAFGSNEHYMLAGSAIQADCDTARSNRRTAAIITLAAGFVVFGYAASQTGDEHDTRRRPWQSELEDA